MYSSKTEDLRLLKTPSTGAVCCVPWDSIDRMYGRKNEHLSFIPGFLSHFPVSGLPFRRKYALAAHKKYRHFFL